MAILRNILVIQIFLFLGATRLWQKRDQWRVQKFSSSGLQAHKNLTTSFSSLQLTYVTEGVIIESFPWTPFVYSMENWGKLNFSRRPKLFQGDGRFKCLFLWKPLALVIFQGWGLDPLPPPSGPAHGDGTCRTQSINSCSSL